MRSRLLIFLVTVVAGSFALGVAHAQGTVSGTVTRLADGSPVQGAAVTLAGSGQSPITEQTGAGGSFSFNAAGGGPYSVGVSAAGFKSQALAGVAAGDVGSIALVPATYIPLALYAGSAAAVVADARSGIFYALMQGAPEVYRTVDYGGSWRPVTMGYDDPANGLLSSVVNSAIASSGTSGEVAIADGFNCGTPAGQRLPVSVSTEYGVSWRTVSGASLVSQCPTRRLELFWGHALAGAPDVLMLAEQSAGGSWDVWRANMSAASPVFVKEPSDPFGQGSQIAVADTGTGSVIGRVSAAGGLSFAPLTASGPIAFGPDQVTGLPAPPALLRLGGAKEGSAPPDGALVVGGSTGDQSAVMLTKAAGAASFDDTSLSGTVVLPNSGSNACLNPNPYAPVTGSVAPTSTGGSGAGNAGGCWFEKSGNTLTVSPPVVFGGDMAYDAGYGQAGNLVSIDGNGLGPVKWAKLDSHGVPVTEPLQSKVATSGTGPDSGGLAITGITSPLIRHVAYGPAGAAEIAVVTDNGPVGSRDGGQTFTKIAPWEGHVTHTVQWWQGASGEWIAFGYGGDSSNMLGAVLNWGGSPIAHGPNVAGSSYTDLGALPQDLVPPAAAGAVTALLAVPGTDTVFIGVQFPSGSHLYRARLTPTDPPALTNLTKLDPSPSVATLYPPSAIAYCPVSSGFAAMRDVLFVGTGPGDGLAGSLLRITGAKGPSPSVALVGSVPHDAQNTDVHDVRADCSSGAVYLADTGQNQTPLFKSVDGGLTFTNLTIAGPDGTPITGFTGISAIGLNPANASDVTVAVGDQGALYHSADGGTTWTLVRDPTVDRPAFVSDIEFAPGSSSPIIPAADARVASADPKFALVATSSGLFDGDLSATSGLMAVCGRSGGNPGAAVRITTLASDSHPSVVAGSGGRLAVFQRSNGLYLTGASSASWSIPIAIPGTRTGDSLPSLGLDQAGGLDLAFRRSAGRAPGIYFTRATHGVWSAPRRLSTGAGDTLPTIAVTGRGTPQIQIAFLRTRGSKRGVYYVSSARGRWSRAARVRGSTAADANPALGAPALATHSNTLELAFSRSGRGAGIYLTTMSKSKWTSPKRLTSASGDSQPSLAIDTRGTVHIVFRRTSGRGTHGLVELKSGKKWSLRHIPGTTSTDQQASLSLNGSTLLLAFAQPSGKTAGVYYDQSARPGRWLTKPRRWSNSAKDRNPSLRSNSRGQITIVFARS